jgi:protein-ribulosamine 3-kinase
MPLRNDTVTPTDNRPAIHPIASDLDLLLPMVRSVIPSHILKELELIEPGARFNGELPRVLSSSGKTYFAKIGSPRETEQYVGEAESLKAMALAAPGLVPSLLAFGFVDENGEEVDGGEGSPFFISEYKNLSPLTERSGTVLGRRLAMEMHNHTSPTRDGVAYYGFEVPTFCGATRLRNGWYETWERCFDVLIGDLLSTLETRRGYSDLCGKGQEVRRRWVCHLLFRAFYAHINNFFSLISPLLE